jgi:hypothetical protein
MHNQPTDKWRALICDTDPERHPTSGPTTHGQMAEPSPYHHFYIFGPRDARFGTTLLREGESIGNNARENQKQ